MNDCPKVEFRDRLPDLVHERLRAEDRAVVMAHVEECVDCRAEFQLLVEMRAVLRVGPKMNVDRIVQSLPLPNQRRGLGLIGGGRFAAWQFAAAAAVLLVGSASLATYYTRQDTRSPAIADSPSVVAANPSVPSRDSVSVSAETVPSVPTSEQELAVGGGLSDLTANDLSHLLSEIERLEPLPQTEPDVGTVSTDAPGDSP
jgi:hypothetical protein